MSPTPLLQVTNVTRHFPGVTALRDVDLTVQKGEVLAVIGENGAGKSTLMKILAGVQTPSSGDLAVDGNAVVIDSVQKATELGIALIHQELNLFDNLDVGANIFLGREPVARGLIDRRTIESKSAEMLEQVGLDVSPRTPVSQLSIGQQQLVEIARALSVNARVLIMDEPTSSLSQQDAEKLFVVVRNLRSQGVSVIYISHRLAEVRELADRVTVLRDGENAGELAGDEITHEKMVSLMVGRDVSEFYQRHPHTAGEIALAASGITTEAYPKHTIDFEIRAGEIVGISGLVGAGRTELLRVLFGIDPPRSGSIRVGDQTIDLKSPLDAISAGIAMVPEDRKLHGLILDMPIRHNVGLAGLRFHKRKGGWLNASQELNDARDMIDRLAIKTPTDKQVVQLLSGGNQQKVVLAKWLALKPRVLLLDEPTRGVDIGAKQEIYNLMDKLAADGVAILFVSSELEEVIGMSDRALVMHEGRITGELSRDELSEKSIMHLATGNVAGKLAKAGS